MDTSPSKALGSLIAIAAILFLSALIILSLYQLFGATLSPFLVVWVLIPLICVPLLMLIIYRWYGLLTAIYRIDRDGFYLKWGLTLEQAPLTSVISIERVKQSSVPTNPRIGFWWPGCVVGTREDPKRGTVEYFTADRGEKRLLVDMEDRSVVISPRDPEGFELAFQSAARMGSLESVPHLSRRSNFVFSQLWSDARARLLVVLGALLPLLLLGYIALSIPSLPSEVPFGFATTGEPNTFVSPAQLLLLPMVAGLCWFIDLFGGMWLYRFDEQKPLAYLVWATAILVGLLFAGATLHLLSVA